MKNTNTNSKKRIRFIAILSVIVDGQNNGDVWRYISATSIIEASAKAERLAGYETELMKQTFSNDPNSHDVRCFVHSIERM